MDTAVFLCSFLTQFKNEQLAVESPWAVGAVSQTRPLVHPCRWGVVSDLTIMCIFLVSGGCLVGPINRIPRRGITTVARCEM